MITTLIRNLDIADRIKFLPLIWINERNTKMQFLSKLYFKTLVQDQSFSIVNPEIHTWHYLKPRKNIIVFEDFERIAKIRYFKTFDTKTRPQTIINAQHKINYAKFNDHIYLDIKENCLFIDIRYFDNDFSINDDTLNKQLFYALYIFKYQLSDELKEQFIDFIKTIKEITLTQIDELFNSIIDNMSVLCRKRMITNSTEHIKNRQSRYFSHRQSALQREKEKILEEIRSKQNAIDSVELNIKKLNELNEDLFNFLNRYFSEKQLINIIADGSYLNLITNYLTVDFYNEVELEKIVNQNQLQLSEKRNTAIRSVLNYEAHFAILPVSIEILIDYLVADDNGIPHLHTKFMPIMGGDNFTNTHSTFSGRRGCLGSFKVEFEIARKEDNLKRIIAISLQYLRTLTVHDPAGNDMIRKTTIIDNNEFIISCPPKPIFEGLKITDLIQNSRLFDESDEEIKKFKEEKYGNQSNAE